MKDHMIPNVMGSKGVNLKEKVFLGSVYPFLTKFMPEQRKCFLVESSPRSWPFTGGTYLQMVWEIKEMQELRDNLLSTFENLTIPSESLWIHKFYDKSHFRLRRSVLVTVPR